MFVIKGIGLGCVMFVVFTVIYFWAWGFWSFGSSGASTQVGADALRSVTVGSYLFWIAAALMLSLGVVIVAMWPVRVSLGQ